MDIRCIEKKDCKPFLEKYHYLGMKGFRNTKIYGLFDGDELVGVCVFHGISAPETAVSAFGLKRDEQDGLYELGRLAMHPRLNGGNHTSWFVSRAIKMFSVFAKAKAIISYADASAGHTGAIYRATNAFYCGVTAPKYDYVDSVTGKVKERFKPEEKGTAKTYLKRDRPQKHRYVWLFDETLTLRWPIISCNWEGIPKSIRKKLMLSRKAARTRSYGAEKTQLKTGDDVD